LKPISLLIQAQQQKKAPLQKNLNQEFRAREEAKASAKKRASPLKARQPSKSPRDFLKNVKVKGLAEALGATVNN